MLLLQKLRQLHAICNAWSTLQLTADMSYSLQSVHVVQALQRVLLTSFIVHLPMCMMQVLPGQ